MRPFHVIETPCFPAKWKVEDRRWPGHDNSTSHYFRDRAKAQAESDRRNNAMESKEAGPKDTGTIIKTALPDISVERLDALIRGCDVIDNLDVLDALIERATELGVNLSFDNGDRVLSLDEARRIRFDLFLDIR